MQDECPQEVVHLKFSKRLDVCIIFKKLLKYTISCYSLNIRFKVFNIKTIIN